MTARVARYGIGLLGLCLLLAGCGDEPTQPVDDVAPRLITNLAAEDSTASSVTLAWSAPGDDGAMGTAAAYDMRYSTSPLTAGTFETAAQATGEPMPSPVAFPEDMVVGGLAAGTTYYFGIKASDEAGNASGLSNVVMKSTAVMLRARPTSPRHR